MKLFLSLAIFTMAVEAGEFVVLSNGFLIHADSHAIVGDEQPVRSLSQTKEGLLFKGTKSERPRVSD